MEEQQRRGRARGRSRGVLPGQEAEGISGVESEVETTQPMNIIQRAELQAMMYESDDQMSGNGSDHRDKSQNGSGGSGGDRNGQGHSAEGAAGTRGFRQENPDFVNTRPEGLNKRGTSGEARRYLANFFELQTKKSVSMRLHSVAFSPDVDEGKVRKGLLKQKEDLIGPYLFDGSQIFTAKKLSPEEMEFDVHFPNQTEVYHIKIKFIRQITSLEPLAFQLYNLIIRKTQMLLDLNLLGRHYYDAAEKIEISNYKLELWPGFITSMRQQESEILLNVDLTYKVIRMDDVFALMREIRINYPETFQEQCNAAIVGTIVLTRYNNKTYRVDEIDWTKKPTDTFPLGKTGRLTTFIDYYKRRYGKTVNASQPLLISKPKLRDIRRKDTTDKLLIPELCFQTGLNDNMRTNFRLMKELAGHLHQPPAGRLGAIRTFMRRIADSNKVKQEMQERWGMRLKCDPVEVQGRVLPSESIVFQNGEVKPNEQADWSAAFRTQRMLSCKILASWVLLVTQRDQGNTASLIQTMQRVATPMGYRIDRPEIIPVRGNGTRDFTAGIQLVMAKYKTKIDMIMVVLPNNRLDTYAAVKRACTVDYGVRSQCFLAKHLSKPQGLMSICTKLVIQMNAKQGGEPWSVKNPLQGIMVVGFDVYQGGDRSIGAMVASVTPTLGKYYSTITSQEADNMEMSAKIGAAFERCIKAFQRFNKHELPRRIFFYRDGVGEGQLQYVNMAEVPELKKVIKRMYSGVEPKFTFVVVTKRVNARIFEINGSREEVRNPLPGTVIDDRITCPERYDFYLIPQSARQGTVSPVSFNVLTDNSGLDADKMQRFTFKLCHVYFNWCGTVPVPAPCQYAHKLAFLTGTALQREASNSLSDFLHFL